MNAKAKGTRNEHRSIAILEAAGYRCTRAAASIGEFDIIAIGPTDFILCQVKTGRWCGSEEEESMKLFPTPPNCKKLQHRWMPRKKLPDVKEI